MFRQRCRGSAPRGPVWGFSPTPRVLRWPGALVSCRRPSPSCRRRPCEDKTSALKPTEPEGSEGLAFGRISLLPEELLEGAPEASFLLLPTPLTEGGVVTLLCPAPPLCLLPPRLEPRVLETSNVNYSLRRLMRKRCLKSQ